jgi:hypothetical protein
MQVEMFFNDLSYVPAAIDVPTAHRRTEQFVRTLREAASRGVQRVLRAPEGFLATQLAPGYFWKDWFVDSRVQREVRQYFRSLNTKMPFLTDMPEEHNRSLGLDFFHNGGRALGLGACYIGDGLCVSLTSNPPWNVPSLDLEVHEIVEDTFQARNERVCHASTVAHVVQHDAWIKERLERLATSSMELWNRRAEWFPRLEFCTATENQISRLPRACLPIMVRGLHALSIYCADWRGGAFDPHRIECSVSPETQSTLQQYSAERTFMCPDGINRVFSWHVKLGHWRVHFHPEAAQGHLYIGYLGKHLSTARFH